MFFVHNDVQKLTLIAPLLQNVLATKSFVFTRMESIARQRFISKIGNTTLLRRGLTQRYLIRLRNAVLIYFLQTMMGVYNAVLSCSSLSFVWMCKV